MQATPGKEQSGYTPAGTPAEEMTNREIKSELGQIEEQEIRLATRRTALEREHAKRATSPSATPAKEPPGPENEGK
jgi:hypothetical protein